MGSSEYLRRLIDGRIQRPASAPGGGAHQERPLSRHQNPRTVQLDRPKKINRLAVQSLFRLEFLAQNANVVFLATSGSENPTWPPPWVTLLAWRGTRSCSPAPSKSQRSAASGQKNGGLKRALKKYLRPEIVILDEVGYLPIDQKGPICSSRSSAAIRTPAPSCLTTNKALSRQWGSIFTMTAPLPSGARPLLHHAETIVIEGASYRMKDQPGD